MSPFGHYVTASSVSIALLRSNEWSLNTAISEIFSGYSLELHSSGALLMIALGIVAGSRGPDRLEIPSFNPKTKERRSLIPHRTLTHWPFFWFAISILVITIFLSFDGLLIRSIILSMIGFVIACWLHLALDILTPAGIPLLNPFGRRVTFNVYKSGSSSEILIVLVIILFTQIFLPPINWLAFF
ncbi:metal-dependent hydrolase [Methylomonas sp. AM2-LC]|uniref:metal-dependent hydrolase n=1 Tax=Methylomonas sp. AM2-LC TaxID=3153301 RepID=UPI0032673344